MVRANRIPIKAVNKVKYQWGKYCMINVCSMDVPWMSLPFFLSFNPLAPNYCFPYNFYDSEMFFRLVVSMDQGDIVSSQGLKIFLFATAMLETKHKKVP